MPRQRVRRLVISGTRSLRVSPARSPAIGSEVSMKTRALCPSALSALALATLAGSAFAQITIDGRIQGGESSLYQQLWVQNQPTGFGDSAPFVAASGNPEVVNKGIEFRIPVSALGLGASTTEPIKFMAWMTENNDNNISNQVVGAALPANSPALGAAATLNFGTIPGDQFLSIVPTLVSTAPAFDGDLDGGVGGAYGTRFWLQTNFTSLGNNTQTTPGGGNGSELNAVYAVRFDNGTAADASDDVLYLFLAGNLAQGPKCNLVFDTVPGGQNTILATQPDQGFGYFRRITGLTYDAGFEADHHFAFNKFGGTMFLDYVAMPTGAPAAGGAYVGGIDSGLQAATPGMGAGGGNNPPVALRYDNSNIDGVQGSPAGLVSPTRITSFGSELNNLSAYVADGKLHLFLGGNLENNYNSMLVFIDANATDGQNQLRGVADQPPNPNFDAGNGLNRMGNGGNDPNGQSPGPGLKFDAGFTADYLIRVGGDASQLCGNAAVIRSNGRLDSGGFQVEFSSFFCTPRAALANPVEVVNFPGTTMECQPFADANDPPETNNAPRSATTDNNLLSPTGCDPVNTGQFQNPVFTPGRLQLALDNSNGAGVTGTTADNGAAAAVSTGVEIVVDLAELGYDGSGTIKVAGFVNGSGYDFMSNQVIGGLPGTNAANLGEPALVDFSALAGDQFVTITVAGGPPRCGSIDFNGDSLFPDDSDLIDFLAVLAGGECSTGTCGIIDFNRDGLFPDDNDLIDFLTVLAGGTPTTCLP
jgi:hypothetical protein